MTAGEIIEDERLDALDPLRHLRNDSLDISNENAEGAETNTILPSQQQTVTSQTVELQLEGLGRPLLISVDAGPGCGGVVWPAGEVSTESPTARIHQLDS
jgi:protein N-lysine methyltransferase METTL21A